MTVWRLLNDGITDAHHHFAVEESLARLLDEGHSPPTLRLRRVRRAVFIGVSQDTWAEVDVDFCRAHNVKIVRRMNGGGAVYHDVGSFCYSAFFPRQMFPQKDADLFGLFARPVLRTCTDYGLAATVSGRNDITVNGRKLYGSAQMAWYAAFVQSGTFLVDIDMEMLWQTLKPSALKFADKSITTIQERVTSLDQELGHAVPVTEVMTRFADNFAAEFGLTLQPGPLSAEEATLAETLWTEKYSTDAWNLGTAQRYSTTVATKTPLGIVSLSVDMDGDVICAARITGDVLQTDGGQALNAAAQALVGHTLAAATAVIASQSLPGVVREAVAALLRGNM